MLKPRIQGGLGEASAIQWLAFAGYAVFAPINHSPDIDLIAVSATERLAVEVKTSTRFERGTWQVMLCTRGGNQSWNGVVKHFQPDRCDRVFVVTGDGRRFFVPTSAITSSSGICVGGPKYAAYEVEPGPPLEIAPAILSPPRRDSEAVKRTGL